MEKLEKPPSEHSKSFRSSQSQHFQILITSLPALPPIILVGICKPIAHQTHFRASDVKSLTHPVYHFLLVLFLFVNGNPEPPSKYFCLNAATPSAHTRKVTCIFHIQFLKIIIRDWLPGLRISKWIASYFFFIIRFVILWHQYISFSKKIKGLYF